MIDNLLMVCSDGVAAIEFETVLGTTTPTITAPLLKWSKDRNNSEDHRLSNSVIGHTAHQRSNTTDTETTCGTTPSITTDDITFYFGDDGTATHTASNTNGTITSETKAMSWFSVASWLGNTTLGATVGHGLPVAPEFIITKARDGANNWACYHKTITATDLIYLNLNNGSTAYNQAWDSTEPTSSVFSIGDNTVTNSGDMIAYCFASEIGVCKVGTVTVSGGTMSGDTNLGFPLGFGMFKRENGTGDWEIINSETTNFLVANDGSSETSNGADRVTVVGNIISNNGIPDGIYIFVAIK